MSGETSDNGTPMPIMGTVYSFALPSNTPFVIIDHLFVE